MKKPRQRFIIWYITDDRQAGVSFPTRTEAEDCMNFIKDMRRKEGYHDWNELEIRIWQRPEKKQKEKKQ